MDKQQQNIHAPDKVNIKSLSLLIIYITISFVVSLYIVKSLTYHTFEKEDLSDTKELEEIKQDKEKYKKLQDKLDI